MQGETKDYTNQPPTTNTPSPQEVNRVRRRNFWFSLSELRIL